MRAEAMQRALPAGGLFLVLFALFLLTAPSDDRSDVAADRAASMGAVHVDPHSILSSAAAHTAPLAAARVRQGMARLFGGRGEFPKAARELQVAKALAEASNPLAAAALGADLGRTLLQVGDLLAARQNLEAARATWVQHGGPSADPFEFRSELYPDPGELFLGLGQAAKAAGKYEEALEAFQQAEPWMEREGRARLAAAQCDVLQMMRELKSAIKKCFAALSVQPRGHPDRPATERVLGLVYYFGGDARRALGMHASAWRALTQAGAHHEAAWLREYMLDDEAAALEEQEKDPSAYAPLAEELERLIAGLRAVEEPLWWRISDAELRLADLFRKQARWPEAEAAVDRALAAFQNRPEGWQQVPDYATIFELKGVVAREQGNTAKAQEDFAEALRILEGCADTTIDVRYLKDEIDDLAANSSAAPAS